MRIEEGWWGSRKGDEDRERVMRIEEGWWGWWGAQGLDKVILQKCNRIRCGWLCLSAKTTVNTAATNREVIFPPACSPGLREYRLWTNDPIRCPLTCSGQELGTFLARWWWRSTCTRGILAFRERCLVRYRAFSCSKGILVHCESWQEVGLRYQKGAYHWRHASPSKRPYQRCQRHLFPSTDFNHLRINSTRRARSIDSHL